ncbi:MAG: hypothetical protein KatS3mg015_2689 [Fimbriimonadales bacterium]|nr:MAG: hypothetical protein KatS3mg015_2689 [Fimbriimonadales bacterium]
MNRWGIVIPLSDLGDETKDAIGENWFGEVAGFIVDLLNPLSDVQDIVNLAGGLVDKLEEGKDSRTTSPSITEWNRFQI